ncbi:tumor susceptibility gene 101 protein-like [Physella acuta]|uniref:tumor susceptibility gene 101 protein-like n=1 Tax=Physella acuta TaxID=109671 RepID=UPI0027DD1DB6|nr:tumor susceptibility gene 101 protein-like [Physella acuta]
MAQYDTQLRTYLSKYIHSNEARADINNTISQYKDLRPTLSPFVFNDGTDRELVQLEGTIPVNYKGNTYNIPISIWVLDTHPHNPPMVFVKPTNTMQIKPGRYVDANGKVDMPYIRDWKHPSADLLSLVQVLAFTFGEECPVFSRTSGQRQPQLAYPGQTPYPVNPSMPYPSAGSGGPGGYPAGGYPPYPGSYPSYPPYPQPSQNNGYPQPFPYPGANNPPYPAQTQGPPNYPPASGSYPPVQSSSNPPYPMSNSGSGEIRYPAGISTGGTVTEADLRASLMSAVEDKIKWRLRETFAQAQAEMDVLRKTQKDLSTGKIKLETIITELEKEQDDLEKNIAILQSKDKEVKDAIQKMESSQDMNIDDAVVTTTPLYRQLVDAFAEEQAIEDAIYYLGEALRKNVIELESFLKRVRELSRKQFMLRATIQKCREKAGLAPLA